MCCCLLHRTSWIWLYVSDQIIVTESIHFSVMNRADKETFLEKMFTARINGTRDEDIEEQDTTKQMLGDGRN